MQEAKIHPMRVVTRRTGLTSHVIRVWERRYGAVEPARTPTNRRLYSDADVERLQQLQQATLLGHSISQIARFTSAQLVELVAADNAAAIPTNQAPPSLAPSQDGASPLENCLEAVRQMDVRALENALFRAEAALGRKRMLTELVDPLMHQIGEGWDQGHLRIADEHMATAAVRSFLGTLFSNTPAPDQAPRLVVTTPAGQWHEIGALMVALLAAAEGWQVIYLGPNLPAEEIAGASLKHQTRAVVLSIVYPEDTPHQLSAELTKLRRALGDETAILVGGRGALPQSDTLANIGAILLSSLDDLAPQLASLRLTE